MGHHIIGYEAQKIRVAINWFNLENRKKPDVILIAIVEYNEGDLMGFYAGAIDNRVKVTMGSNYLSKRDRFMGETICINVFGQLKQLGNTEMAPLIAPRSLMVERGHKEAVPPDERVAYEYAKVRGLYVALGIPEKTEIEFFSGPHNK